MLEGGVSLFLSFILASLTVLVEGRIVKYKISLVDKMWNWYELWVCATMEFNKLEILPYQEQRNQTQGRENN